MSKRIFFIHKILTIIVLSIFALFYLDFVSISVFIGTKKGVLTWIFNVIKIFNYLFADGRYFECTKEKKLNFTYFSHLHINSLINADRNVLLNIV